MTINFNRKLLIFIVVILLISLFAAGVPGSVFSKLTTAGEYNSIHYEYENMYQNLNMKSSYEKNKINLIKKINRLNIDTEIFQDQIINVLSDISTKNSIALSNIKFSEIMPVFKDTSEGSEESVELQQDSTAVCMKVTVDFDSDFHDMISFIEDVKNSETEISVIDISILLIDSDKVHVMLSLMFYALPLYVS